MKESEGGIFGRISGLKPNFERLRKTLLLEGEPDKVPLIEVLIDKPVKEAFLGKPLESVKDDVEFWYEAGYDYIGLWPDYNFNPTAIIPKEGTRKTYLKRSVYTEEEMERSWAPEGKGIITSIRDFENHPWHEIKDVDFSMFKEGDRFLPDGMKIIGESGDIFATVWWLMGFETFSFALAEDIELIELLFEKIGSIIYEIFLRIVEFENIGALWYCDDIAYSESLLISPHFYRKYLFPWMKKIGDIAKSRELPYIYHSDGNLWQVMEDLADCGVNALHPIEPKAMDAREVKAKMGDKFCMLGNIEVDKLARGTIVEIDEMVKERIRNLAPGGGYCIGSSNTIPDYIPLENYKAMLRAVERYGMYPITL